MANISVLNMEGKEVGSLELNDAIFAVEVKEHLMHRAVVLQLANNRQGTQSAKTRAAVRGGGREPVMPDRVLSEAHSGEAAVLFLHHSQEIIHLR